MASIINTKMVDKVLSASDKKPVRITLKKGIRNQTDPGNWMDSKTGSMTITKPPPLVNAIDGKLASTFASGRAFDESADTVQCKHCKKPVSRLAAAGHIMDCLRKKQEKQQKKKEAKEAKDAALRKERNGGVSPASADEDGSKRLAGGSARKSAKDLDDEGSSKKTSKKRKADDDVKGPSAKKKKKDEPKPKAAKPKGPVDVEKQCGVQLPNGSMCARSLTCKSHSMGAKRAVPGRSAPYDVLLAQYQKKNQAKQQRAAMDANAPLADDFELQGVVDSDEERDAVMAAINRYYKEDPYSGIRNMGKPLSAKTFVPLRRRYQYIRLKGALQEAMSGVNGAKLFATPATME